MRRGLIDVIIFQLLKQTCFNCRQTTAVPARSASSDGLEKSPLSKTVILKNSRREGMKKSEKRGGGVTTVLRDHSRPIPGAWGIEI